MFPTKKHDSNDSRFIFDHSLTVPFVSKQVIDTEQWFFVVDTQ